MKMMQLARGIVEQKEFLIKHAIEHCIGKDWTVDDIKGRGEFTVLPDNTEVFSFDGQEMIHFYHTRVEVDNSHKGTFMRALTDYRLLYE